MVVQEIHIIGDEEIVSMLGLLGLEGTIVNNEEEFLKKFSELMIKPSVGMMIVAFDLSNQMIDYLLEYKKANKRPFIFILPDIFQPNVERDDIIFKKIIDALGDSISI
jgi:vacuolar-type H+-ATPase subunit F/Vma7